MNTPTKITVSRIAAIIVMLIALFVLSLIPNLNVPIFGETGINLIFFIVFFIFIIASFTDFLDGYLARKNNQVTDLGKFLDPVADKLLINSMVIFLVAPALFAPYASINQIAISGWCAIIIILRDIVVDALRFIAAQKKVVIAANIFGKMKTVLEMIAISLVLLNGFPFSFFDASWTRGLHITDFIVYITTLVSFLSGVIYVYQNRKVFAKDAKKVMLEEIKETLTNKKLTLGSVESFTGGRFAEAITSISGSSKFYKGTMVTYATELKASLLNIDQTIIDKKGVVSEEVAREMALKGKDKLNVDICVSFTGNAGPDAMEGKPVGEVYIGVVYLDKCEVIKYNLSGKRDEIQAEGVQESLKLVLKTIK